MYQAGFSNTLRRITGGVMVPAYPMPMKLVRGALRAARSRSAAITSGSERAAGRFSSSSGADRFRNGLVEQLIQRLGTDDVEHVTELGCVGTDVAVDELVGKVGQRDWHDGLRTSRVPIAPRCPWT